MLFTSGGSSNVLNRRIIVIGKEKFFPQRPTSSIGDHPSVLHFGRNSQGSASCPETLGTYAESPASESPRFGSRSNSRSSSRTETLRPGQWTTVTPHVKLRALSLSEQQEVFEAQRRSGLLYEKQPGECFVM